MNTTEPSKTSPAADGKSRQAALRERRAAEGLTRLELYVRPEHHQRVRDFAAGLSASDHQQSKGKA